MSMLLERSAGRLSASSWLILIGLACVTAVLAMGAHDMAISHLGVPYPDDEPPAFVRYLGAVARIAATVQLCRLAAWFLDRRGRASAAIVMGVLIVCFQETLRIVIIDNVLVHGWIDGRWIFMALKRLPNATGAFFQGAVSLLIARSIPRDRRSAMAIAVLISAAVSYFALVPGVEHAASSIDLKLGLSEPPELYQPPYDLRIYSYIYGTFIEATAAVFALASLTWPALRGSTARRVTVFAILLLLARGRVLGTFLNSFWSNRPILVAMAADGQFFAETLVLVVLAGLSWAYVSRRARAVGRLEAAR